MDIGTCILVNLKKIRQQRPLIHNITNFVVMNSSANIILALGASPVMAHCKSEVEEMVSLSKSLVLNIGTLDEHWVESMIKAAKTATKLKIPIILDVVGAGATNMRTKSALKIIEESEVSVIKGNVSEILALSSKNTITKGVDSSIKINKETVILAKQIARAKHCTVAISGEKDIITDGFSVTSISNGHPIMTRITGMGCGLTAFIGSFCAVENNNYYATISACALYGVCGDLVGDNFGNKPGNFFPNFLDTIHAIEPTSIPTLIKINTE